MSVWMIVAGVVVLGLLAAIAVFIFARTGDS